MGAAWGGHEGSLLLWCLILSAWSLAFILFVNPHLSLANLKQIIKPDDEVASYFKFYQDVPLYLGKRITLVANWDAATIAYKDNWVRELWYGMAFQKTADWLINENTFWQRWNSNKRMFVFVNTNYFDQFKAQATHYYKIDAYNDIVLLSNQPITE